MRVRFVIRASFFALVAVASAHAGENSACVPGKNDYLERYFGANSAVLPVDAASCENSNEKNASLSVSNLASQLCSTESSIPAECFAPLVDTRPKVTQNVFYGFCDSEDGQPKTRISGCKSRHGRDCRLPAPCSSPGYVNFVRSSYLDATKCVGIDPRETFGLVGAESRFNVNIRSAGGVWGISQVTSGAFFQVQRKRWLDELVGKPECSGFKKVLTEGPHDHRGPCRFVSLPGNPGKSFIYMGIIYKHLLSMANGLLDRYRIRLPEETRGKIARDLAIYMYNGGYGGIRQVFHAFIMEHGVRNYARFSRHFRDFLRENYGGGLDSYQGDPDALQARREEVSNYRRNIQSVTDSVRKRTGIQCAF